MAEEQNMRGTRVHSPDLDWSQVRETVLMLELAAGQISAAMHESNEPVNVLTSGFTSLASLLARIQAALGALPDTPENAALKQELLGSTGEVNAVVKLDPPAAADDAEWLTVTAWQGQGFVVDRLEKIGPGTYRTTQPIPVHGSWKALIRMHRGNEMGGVPIFLPEDTAIPAKEVPAEAQFTRPFVAENLTPSRKLASACHRWAISFRPSCCRKSDLRRRRWSGRVARWMENGCAPRSLALFSAFASPPIRRRALSPPGPRPLCRAEPILRRSPRRSRALRLLLTRRA